MIFITDALMTWINIIVASSFRLSVRKGRSYLGKLGMITADEVSEQTTFLGG